MNSSSGPPPLSHHQSFQSQYSGYSHSTARDTQSTQATSSSTLFGQPPVFPSSTPVNGGPVEASNNVLNKRADKDTSLFQRCITLQQRLRAIPGFEAWMIDEENKADDDADPVTILWRTFRRGYPLMDVYNALSPNVRLSIDEGKVTREEQRAKMASYKFLQACIAELKFPSEECFILGDLYGDDTTGFVKVSGACKCQNNKRTTLTWIGYKRCQQGVRYASPDRCYQDGNRDVRLGVHQLDCQKDTAGAYH